MQLGPEDIAAGVAAADTGDDVDLWYDQGKAGAVAMKGGAHVCWECMELLVRQETHPKLRPVTISVGGDVPVYLHAKCANARIAPKLFLKMSTSAKGMHVRRRVANIVKQTKHLIIGGDG